MGDMRDDSAERRRILASPPPELVAEAAANPNGSVAMIDSDDIADPDGYIPPEAIQGVWRIDADGKLTGEFEPNPNYGPPKDDFAKLTEAGTWTATWLGDQPGQAIRQSITDCLNSQAPGAVVEWVKIVDEPRYLTAGRPQPDDENYLIVTKAGIAAPFALAVTAPGRKREILTGVFTWVAVRLDQPGNRKDQVWLDLWTDLDRAEAELRNRLYLVGQANPGPTG